MGAIKANFGEGGSGLAPGGASGEPHLAGILRDIADDIGLDGHIQIPLSSFLDADGDPLVKFADGASAVPGWNLADSEAFGIRWNNHATPNPVLTQVSLPADLDPEQPMVVNVLASKVGATVGDAVTFTTTAFFHTVGALHDADANAGGATSAMVGNAATKTVQRVTRTIAAVDVPAPPASLTLTLKPTDGLLGTDDVIVESVWISYKKLVKTTKA
jgi:hypothetical protein